SFSRADWPGLKPAGGQDAMDKAAAPADGSPQLCPGDDDDGQRPAGYRPRRAGAHGLHGEEKRGNTRGVSQAAPVSGWRAGPPGAVPGAWLVEFGAVLLRPDGAAGRRVFNDERVRRPRLRCPDDGPRELRPLV